MKYASFTFGIANSWYDLWSLWQTALLRSITNRSSRKEAKLLSQIDRWPCKHCLSLFSTYQKPVHAQITNQYLQVSKFPNFLWLKKNFKWLWPSLRSTFRDYYILERFWNWPRVNSVRNLSGLLADALKPDMICRYSEISRRHWRH